MAGTMAGMRVEFGSRLLKQISSLVITRRFLPELRRRFYRNVTVAGTGNFYEVNLDHRKLKTPHGNVLQVPNYGLALAVAHEWASMKDKILSSHMHLTGLANTVIDNPNHKTKLDFVNKTLEYLDTDTLLYRDEVQVAVNLEPIQLTTVRLYDWQYDRFGPSLLVLLEAEPLAFPHSETGNFFQTLPMMFTDSQPALVENQGQLEA